jgi:hypothetical protein
VDSRGTHLHVSIAAGDVAVGTLRQSIYMALDMIVVRAMTLALRQLDYDFNISLLSPLLADGDDGDNGDRESVPPADRSVDLWFSLTAFPTVFDMSALSGALTLAGHKQSDVYEEIPSSGRRGPFAARFPFSYKLVQVLDDPETRATYEKGVAHRELAPEAVCARLDQLCRAVFDEQTVDLWAAVAGSLDYLHDYVAIAAPPLPNLSLRLQLRVYRAVLEYTLPGQRPGPAWAHAGAMFNALRLFHISSLLAQVGWSMDIMVHGNWVRMGQ